jgi:transcriptional regulator of nitric oxide reductase
MQLAGGWLLAAAMCLTLAGPSAAGNIPLSQRLTPDVLAIVWPNAERLGPEQGTPPIIPVYKTRMETRNAGANGVTQVVAGEDIIGYIFSTADVVNAPGYSSIVFDVLAGVTTDGIITGAKVVFHEEPHIKDDAVRQPKLDIFLANHSGAKLQGSNTGLLPTDFVAGATISTRAMRQAIYNAARTVLRAKAPRPAVTEPTLDADTFVIKSWDQLLAEGSVVRKTLTNREAAALLEKAGGPGVKPEVDFGSEPDAPYIEVFTGLATPLSIGGNLFGTRDLGAYRRGGHVFAVASNGTYDFVGAAYYRPGVSFDRLRVVQGDNVFEFKRDQFQRYSPESNGFRGQRYSALYYLPPGAQFDPLAPWRLEILVNGTGPKGKVTAAFPIDYKLPASHILMPEVEAPPAWLEAWQEQRTQITILGAALVVLTLILALQHQLTRYRRTYRIVRNGFLAFTVVWMGWIAGAQLSIINVMNYLQAPFRDFDIGFYLAEPLIVIVALYTAVSLLILGRGVFCGWLCPFGALQELLGQISRALRLPQWNPSETTQRKMWMLKYVAAAAVLGLAFINTDAAMSASEVEPFKTAITAHFVRGWPFVLYAGALLGVGLFTERAYCRFLCPLGGTLAALDRLHVVDMLKRRPECGNPCHLCETSCPVKAVETSGKIKMAECFQCLDCQVEYYDDQRCPPLAKARKLKLRAKPDVLPIPAAARGAAAE